MRTAKDFLEFLDSLSDLSFKVEQSPRPREGTDDDVRPSGIVRASLMAVSEVLPKVLAPISFKLSPIPSSRLMPKKPARVIQHPPESPCDETVAVQVATCEPCEVLEETEQPAALQVEPEPEVLPPESEKITIPIAVQAEPEPIPTKVEPADVKVRVIPRREKRPRKVDLEEKKKPEPEPKPLKVIRRRAQQAPIVFETQPKHVPHAMLVGVEISSPDETEDSSTNG